MKIASTAISTLLMVCYLWDAKEEVNAQSPLIERMHFLFSDPRDQEKHINPPSCWDALHRDGSSNSEGFRAYSMHYEQAKIQQKPNNIEQSSGGLFFVVVDFKGASKIGGACGQCGCKVVRHIYL
jgi:hypothetical protein